MLSWPWCWLCRWFTCLQTVIHTSSNYLIMTQPRIKPKTSRTLT